MEMRVELHRMNQASHFEARNGDGNTVSIDGAPSVGGEQRGFRPMQLALTALASCAAMDVGPILAKQRQSLTDMRITATGQRGDGSPSPFTAINLHFDLWGAIEEPAAHRALDLAVYKYCSVGAMLRCSVEITWTLTIHEEPQ
ncbi:MAG: OsmC family protein [Alkalispirochaeta sp.]